MIKNIIIGKSSNLSYQLSSNLDNAYLIGAREILGNPALLLDFINTPVNIIFNNFQPARHLNDLQSPLGYIEAAIYTTSKVLEILKSNDFKVNKIIYTSSSSVYGDNILCHETDNLVPKSLHAALKVANEKLIIKFCSDHKINYTIARIFNMYGGDDNFSVVSKIIDAYKNQKVLPIVNHGNSIRDFIHIDDVVKVYKRLLAYEESLPVINVGTGIGNSIKGIMDFLENRGICIDTENKTIDELKVSTADSELMHERLGIDEFIDIKEFILEQLKGRS